ncbi:MULTISPECIES: hypothetical protein [unclassified Sporolactobacillus]|uniref:hypothetical protein n=1 Tax=unclassified Sporolactobacillus TaxID=2628533 RepID=UPI00236879C6|nr:hypothetical protein [Sporolactobacillus sp. CQH2019]MDD9149107.1 hypothetical protein [Sporolactobacillus sp. CQH2019]
MNDEIETDETSELDFIRHLLPDNKAALCEWGHPINLYDFKTSGRGLPCFNDEGNEILRRDRTGGPIRSSWKNRLDSFQNGCD